MNVSWPSGSCTKRVSCLEFVYSKEPSLTHQPSLKTEIVPSSVLQCVAVCCNVLYCVATWAGAQRRQVVCVALQLQQERAQVVCSVCTEKKKGKKQHGQNNPNPGTEKNRESPALCYNTIQHTATHCLTLQYTMTHYNTLQHNTTHCTTLHHTIAHCNALQHTVLLCSVTSVSLCRIF